MTFKSAYIKLTFYYVLIIMAISVVFSFAIYRISTQELNRGFNRQSKIFRQPTANQTIIPTIHSEMERLLQEQLIESKSKIFYELFYLNLVILVLTTIGSYFLAKLTLEPVEEMMEAQNNFTADASHELKTPLAAMKTEIEVNLRDKALPIERAKNLLRSNLEEIDKLETLSNALLNLARYQEDLKLDFQDIPLNELITEAYEKVESLAGQKNIIFNKAIPNQFIKGDRQSLVELFVILFDNAIKYSPSKSNTVITGETRNNKLFVKIKDEGIGIKASDLPYIFNRFYRADSSRSKEKITGYGLGLPIAKRIVELHKGSITVTSTPNKGTEFTISFSL
jgi:two-component system sensor histidine kinase CiaH